GAAIGAGIGMLTKGAGLATYLGFDKGSVGANVVNGAAQNGYTQGLAIATGQQSGFDWRSMAAAAIAAPLTASLDNYVTGETRDGVTTGGMGWARDNPVAGRFATQLVGGMVSGTIRQLMTGGGRLQFANIAADAFGNAFGNAVVGTVQEAFSQQKKLAQVL